MTSGKSLCFYLKTFENILEIIWQYKSFFVGNPILENRVRKDSEQKGGFRMEASWNAFWQSGSVEDYLNLKGIVSDADEEGEAKRESDSDRDRDGAISGASRGLR